MKPLYIFLIGLVAFFGIVFLVPSYRQSAVKALSYSACDTPLQYRIGSIDQRFGLSKEKALEDISIATDIWTAAEGKKLFEYSQNASLTVNFVYDSRQELNTAINQLDTKLDQSNKELQQQIADYKARVAAFEQKLSAFQKTVQKYNREGGVPPDVYDGLVAQQKELQAEGNALNAQARQLKLSTNDYNANVSTLNNDVYQFNDAITQKPEEGVYDGGNDTITIYFVNSHQELVHTLTHELGHALGMDHVVSNKSIMYPYTTSFIFVTPDDAKQLAYVCREQSAIAHGASEFLGWIALHAQGVLKPTSSK